MEHYMTNTTHYLTTKELDKLLFWYAFNNCQSKYLGEWVCEMFGWGDPRLYYTQDNKKAERILRTEYIKELDCSLH